MIDPRVRCALPFVSLVISFTASSARPALAQFATRDLTQQIDSLAQATLPDWPPPGLSLAVARGETLVIARGYGYADLERRIPATPQTVYHIGSITKEMTAAAVMQLVDAKRLRLDDEISRFVPEYPEPGGQI